ncbi:hypothetical protein CALVIDRAFT_564783 [Calocera viscosa TUFC12733]|uniref:F-box domain-containing protein n=1 Tax=Calocera viscosa (strain TUFC12733) TaxID=1330018 RepID=A0A167L673_CALVF|nr:hypothetical protein CALVIDRAFT_564783 [Calocera viscosa TUFC12733]
MAVLSAEVMCEILDLVVPRRDTRYIDGARPSYSELKQLCLVCRSWSTYIQYRLFDHVDLGTFDARLAFLRAIGRKTTRSRDLQQTTRTLVLSGTLFRPGGPRDVLDVLSQLPSLDTVHVQRGFSLPYLPRSTYVPRDFPTIQSFDIEMSNGSSWGTLHDLLRKLPTLRRLAIRDFNATGSIPITLDSGFPFRLEEFLLLCPWRCISGTYLQGFIEGSVGSLEVLGLSMMSVLPGVDELLANYSRTLRSLGLDTAENVTINVDTLPSLKRLQQLVITTADPDLVGALPPALRRLQFNTALFSQGRPLVDRFIESLQASLKGLHQLNTLFVAGKHLGDLWAKKLMDADDLSSHHLEDRFAPLTGECAKSGIALHSPIDSDDTLWTRFHDLGFEVDTVEG